MRKQITVSIGRIKLTDGDRNDVTVPQMMDGGMWYISVDRSASVEVVINRRKESYVADPSNLM
jgi:hypothetical protein